jgi:hypothetical protein
MSGFEICDKDTASLSRDDWGGELFVERWGRFLIPYHRFVAHGVADTSAGPGSSLYSGFQRLLRHFQQHIS